MYRPSEKEFVKLARKGNLIPVYKEILADLETPVSAFCKVADVGTRKESEYAFLLESVEGGENIARYSFLGICSKSQVFAPRSFSEIKKVLKKYRPVRLPGMPRFHGGLVGYVSYDAVRQLEPRLLVTDKNPDDLKLPLMQFLLTDSLLAFDHVKHKILIVANAFVKNNPRLAYREACRKIDALEKKIKKPVALKAERIEIPIKIKTNFTFTSTFKPKEYEKIVRKAKRYIYAGDIIQVVLSQRFKTPCAASSFNIYRVLRTINPSPYMFYLKFKDFQLLGSSPEVMVRLEKGIATLRPIAGTRPRGKNEEEDRKLEEELLASKKEKAEHIMLVDLGRNDLGRVCEYGSVKVTESMVIEKYSHVMHIVSNVAGKLKKGKDAVDLFVATFPAGTVTGAPKVRAMEIIDELENRKRGLYAGAVGYFDFYGDLDSAIAIRTILIKDNWAYMQAGAGIVADSSPHKEFLETINKARAMLAAVKIAHG